MPARMPLHLPRSSCVAVSQSHDRPTGFGSAVGTAIVAVADLASNLCQKRMYVGNLRLCEDRLMHRARQRNQCVISNRGTQARLRAGLDGVNNKLSAAPGDFNCACFKIEELCLDQLSCLLDPIVLRHLLPHL
jgi:hypothetical protein